MNVFYEEAGTFKVGTILAESANSLQVEATHGKRSKIKISAVLLQFDVPPVYEFMYQAQNIAKDLEINFLWECCNQNTEFTSKTLATEYFGHLPSAVEIAAIMISLNNAPIYFYKKGQGRYKAAPPEALKAALASQEKKRLDQEKQAHYMQQLNQFILPEAFQKQLDALLYAPDKNTIEWKALEAAAQTTKLSPIKLLEKCGAIPSSHDYHFNQFVREYFPDGIAFDAIQNDPTLDHLENLTTASEVKAFSIDDATTTEIDDAFSVQPLSLGSFRIGIHIAAPALGILPGSQLDQAAAKRLSTVYLPGKKITMLPDEVIQHFTLVESGYSPALSLYLDVSDDFTVMTKQSKIEMIQVDANLRHDSLEQLFNEETLRRKILDYPFAKELELLWNFAKKMEALRGKENDINNEKIDYSFLIDGERVTIQERRRGSPIDKVVSELMIYTNTEWGKQLAEEGVAAIYRNQSGGKVRMSLSPAPHQGLGVSQYAWSSSPMRRYVDLINQRQLIALLTGAPPPYTKTSHELMASMHNFEQIYTIYSEFQRAMERYWCLRWLIQEKIQQIEGQVIRENFVKFDHLPLVTRISTLPNLEPGTAVLVEISHIDLLERTLNARFISKINDHA
ncbi:MAG: RNB domain-containing ribonuclease [Nitrosomonas sp.]|nr:MAG: RNB domain-containing ribonuclease [Nitrosomonas sp.]